MLESQKILNHKTMRISTCLAAYNGSKYIELQISSILNQLREQDELIIVEDCSTDDTLKILENIQDSRIRLLKNEVNLGVIKSFEKALSNATKDIIFLSDQDDIWLPRKVEKFLDVFEKYPDVTLVISDAQIIDSNGQLTAESFFKLRGKFTANPFSNFVKSKHHGCTLAFRKEMLAFFLPFPADTPMHDIWIGIVNSIYGKAFYINEPLMQHRRHGKNTGRGIFNNAGIFQIIQWRFSLAKNIVILMLKPKKYKQLNN